MTLETRAPARKPLTTTVATGIAIVILFLAVLAYASPYLVLSRLRDAAQARDAQTIDRYVDYPALRVSLKEQVTQMLSHRVESQKLQHPLAALGALVGMVFVGPLVDAYATPDGVAFTWTNPDPRDGDRYLVGVVTRPDEEPEFEPTAETEVTVPADPSGTTCVEVLLVRENGQSSDAVRGCAP